MPAAGRFLHRADGAPGPGTHPAVTLQRGGDATAFFTLAFGTDTGPGAVTPEPDVVRVPLEPLVPGATAERWLATRVVRRERRGDIGIVATDRDLLVHAARPAGTGLSDVVERTYGDLLSQIRDLGYPHPVRAWNFVPDINHGTGDDEAYVSFNAGRASAFARAGLDAPHFPAGTAVGSAPGAPLVIALLASRCEPVAIENPLQTSAYDYPRRYGPRPPAFARAMLLPDGADATLLVSGTASIVGSESRHGALQEQLAQLLVNLQALAARAIAAGPGYAPEPACSFRVDLRGPGDPAGLEARVRSVFPRCRSVAFVRAEVCRRELLVEAEGVLYLTRAGAPDGPHP